MATEKRKHVIFNVENDRDKVLFDFAADKIPNFSGYVKKCLEAAAKRYGITVPPKEQDTVPASVPVTVLRQSNKP